MTKRSSKPDSRPRSDEEMLSLLGAHLDSLADLAARFDEGKLAASAHMATDLSKILVENNVAVKARGARRFSSPKTDAGPDVLNALHRLVAYRMEPGDPPNLRYCPAFWMLDESEETLENHEFRVWWNREVIWRASCAPPGGPPGLIPIHEEEQLPFEDRARLSRRELVTKVRNSIAAHPGHDASLILAEADQGLSVGDFEVVDQATGKSYSLSAGTLKEAGSPSLAILRQIAHEVLVAYGRDDPRPAQ